MFWVPKTIETLAIQRMEGNMVEGFVKGSGNQYPELLLFGEAPGENEVVQGIPFIGRAGEELMQSLASIGLDRKDVYVTSTIRSRPYRWGRKKERDGTITKRKYNRPPTQKEIIAHAPIIDYEMAHVQPKCIVTLGSVALQRLLGKDKKTTELHGQIIHAPIQYLADIKDTTFSQTNTHYTIIPTFHPASVFYRPSLRVEVEADWNKIGAYLTKLAKERRDLDV